MYVSMFREQQREKSVNCMNNTYLNNLFVTQIRLTKKNIKQIDKKVYFANLEKRSGVMQALLT